MTPCPARGFGTLASVRRRRRRPFERKGLLLMLHHLWCAATLAKGVCPTSELRRALNTESLTVVATRSAWPATGGEAGAWPPEENDSKALRPAVNQRSSRRNQRSRLRRRPVAVLKGLLVQVQFPERRRVFTFARARGAQYDVLVSILVSTIL